MNKGYLDNLAAGAAAGAGTLGAWMLQNASGLIVGVLGLAVQFWFLHRRDQRERRRLEHDIQQDIKENENREKNH